MSTEKNAVATQQATALDMAIDNKFIDQLSSQLTQKQEYGLTFPPTYNVTNALNSAYLILQETKDRNDKLVLQSCSKQSIASSLMDMTVQGLNPMKKQCYFVAMGGKLKLMRSYQGTMAVAKRCGVKAVNAEVIYEGDTFKYHIENGVKYIDEHTQDFMNIDTTKIKGAYAVLTLEDDSAYTEIMNINQIKKAWSKGFGYKDGQGVHGDFGDQMAKKTVITRACKNIINSSDDANLTEAFDSTSDNEEINPIQEDMHHVIDMEANTEEFEVPDQPEKEPEVLQGEVVEDKQVETKKSDKKPSKEPEWV
jgi:recombination protein RecT